MNLPGLTAFTALAAVTAFAALATLAGCAAQPSAAPASARQPALDPAAIAGDFPAMRRCMDDLLVDYGTHDLSVVVEDLADPAARADAGTRDLLAAAMADMTPRSRAIRVVASDGDWSRTRSQAAQAPGREAPAVAPQFALRGAIRTLDGAAAARPGAVALALDLTLLKTSDMSVVPGTGSHTEITAAERGAGAELRKFGARFSLPATAANGAGRSAALRALADVATIEWIGRVARLPYWTCFGVSAADPAVGAEIQDWYDTMAARPAEIIGYFQQQLGVRGLYAGPVDGAVNPPLKAAVARYREALGLSREPKLSLDFFRAYLAADHRELAQRLTPAPATSTATAPGTAAPATVATVATAATGATGATGTNGAAGASRVSGATGASRVSGATVATTAAAPATTTAAPAGAAPLALRIASAREGQRYARGEPVQLTIRPSRDAHVYCFHQDENRRITRFFPNRFQGDSRVPAAGLQLPGAMQFEIVMNPRGVPESVACFATEGDVLARLPSGLNGADFSPLPIASLDQVRSAFLKTTTGPLAQETFQIRAR